MFFVCCGCFASMSQGNLAGEGTSGARADSSVEVGGEEWEDSLVEKLLARLKEQETEIPQLGAPSMEAARVEEGEKSWRVMYVWQ